MYTIGIDLGGTNIAVGLCDDALKIIDKDSVPTLADRPGEEIVADMAALTKKIIERNGLSLSDVEYVGIATPGTANSKTGVVEYANNLPFKNFPISDLFIKALPVKKVIIDNDANAAALGEALAGSGKGKKSFIAVTLGTGVGGGIIIDGKIFAGYNRAGGELGHTVIVKGGQVCGCGRMGCFETYASATALVRQTKAAMTCDRKSLMWELVDNDLSKVSGRTAFDGMRKGDATAKRVVDRYIEYLSVGIVNIINIFQPEMLCIGGGISKEGDNLIKPLMEYITLERYSKNIERQTEICVAKLGNDAGIIGAAFLCNLYGNK